MVRKYRVRPPEWTTRTPCFRLDGSTRTQAGGVAGGGGLEGLVVSHQLLHPLTEPARL